MTAGTHDPVTGTRSSWRQSGRRWLPRPPVRSIASASGGSSCGS
jgi:hypothetical protein